MYVVNDIEPKMYFRRFVCLLISSRFFLKSFFSDY